MKLVLTYHRVVEHQSALAGFFDVTSEELRRHIREAGEIWKHNCSPGDLLETGRANGLTRRGFLITFDDGTADHYGIAAPLLEQEGVRGVFFVNTSRLDRDGYLSVAQCREMQARGHAIESHSHEHKLLTHFQGADLRYQLAESRRRLRELGLGCWDFLAVPGGYFNGEIKQAAQVEHYALLRTLQWGYNRAVNPFSIESVTVNRRTAGRWFRPLISPRFESLKRATYRSKEFIKTGRLGALYFGLRDGRRK